MKIVFFTSEGFASNEFFLYMYARIAGRFPNCAIVSVHPVAKRRSLAGRWQRYLKKIHRLGWRATLEIASSYPLQVYLTERGRREKDALLRRLPRPAAVIGRNSVRVVDTVNGSGTVDTIRGLHPDILIQAGAGILRPEIFKLARIACLNLHHGIAPPIRGMNSIYWGLWENRPEWIGATVHEIDAGIDTGNVLAYAPARQRQPGEGFAPLFARATEAGMDRMLDALARLQSGERWKVAPPAGGSAYRSTMSGWKLAALAWRLRAEKNSDSRGSDRQTVPY